MEKRALLVIGVTHNCLNLIVPPESATEAEIAEFIAERKKSGHEVLDGMAQQISAPEPDKMPQVPGYGTANPLMN